MIKPNGLLATFIRSTIQLIAIYNSITVTVFRVFWLTDWLTYWVSEWRTDRRTDGIFIHDRIGLVVVHVPTSYLGNESIGHFGAHTQWLWLTPNERNGKQSNGTQTELVSAESVPK